MRRMGWLLAMATLSCGITEGSSDGTGVADCTSDGDCGSEERCVDRACTSAVSGGGADGVDAGTGGSSGGSGSGGPAGAGSANGGTAGTSTSPNGGSAGTPNGSSAGSTGTSTVGGCNLPTPPPVGDPGADELERDRLAHETCEKLAGYDCLSFLGGSSFIHEQTDECSLDQQIQACAMDLASEYEQVSAECGPAWLDVLACAIGATYDPSTCGAVKPGTTIFGFDDPCAAEKDALETCTDQSDSWQIVDGTRTSCGYGPWLFSACHVQCEVDGRYFGMDCYGPEGLPVRCSCTVDDVSIGDMNFDDTDVFYASDCTDAATQASNGRCTARLDCCIQIADQCLCGDPVVANAGSCEEVAATYGGSVVEICPRFEAGL